jgi:hypothetical protein
MDEVAPWLGTVLPLLDGAGWFVLAGILYFFLRNVFKNDHRYVAPALLGIVVLVVLLRSTVPDVGAYGYTSWFIWCLLIVMFIRIEHPPVLRSQPLTPLRRVLAILSVVIFLLCFSFTPLRVV